MLRMCVEAEDVRKGLESIDKEIQRLREGRQLIESAWTCFTLMHKDDVADVLNIASRMVEKELERLERAKRMFEEELRRLEG